MNDTPKTPPVSINEVAKRAGVSIMSVSRAIRGVEGVSQTTRERVLEIVRELGYQPNQNARSLAVSKSRLIGVSVPTLFDEVFADILDSARQVLERSGYDLIIETSGYDLDTELVWVEQILKWSPAGLILTGGDHKHGLAERIRIADLPVVEIWDTSENPIDVCVGVNHYEIGALAADHLLACGYKNACLIGIDQNKDPRAEKRFQGFVERFSPHGTTALHRVDVKPSFEAGQAAINELYGDARPEFDALFFLNDHLAFGGLCALEALGYSVPRDVGLIGCNNLGINKVLNKRITTVETPRQQMGQIAGQRLLARIHRATTEAKTILKPVLRLGNTTRAPRFLPSKLQP